MPCKFEKLHCKSPREFGNLPRRFANFLQGSYDFPNFLLKFSNFLFCALSLANKNNPPIDWHVALKRKFQQEVQKVVGLKLKRNLQISLEDLQISYKI